MDIVNRIICAIVVLLCISCSLKAQTVKNIEIDGDTPYVDYVSLVEGDKDMDLIIKILFDEPQNSLKVSLISYRKLFAFQNDVRYSSIVRWHKLRPGKLPYVVETDEYAKYHMNKSLRKSIHPKRKHVFKRWIEYEGLQPQPTVYKMVNDFIEQRFDILPKRNDVTVSLHDVLVMNEEIKGIKKKYDLFLQTDLDRKYNIHIKRDPCFGKEELIQASNVQLESIKAGFATLSQNAKKLSQHNTPNAGKVIDEMKDILLEQFPKNEETSECPEICENISSYNSYVDSISQLKFVSAVDLSKKKAYSELNDNYILTLAKKIDQNVNQWLLSSDDIEKKDLVASCNEIINQALSHIETTSIINERQKSAVNIFYAAKEFFQKTCIKNKNP